MATKLSKQLSLEARGAQPRRSPNVKQITFGLHLDTFGRLRYMAWLLNKPYQELMRELIVIGLWQLEEREAGKRFEALKARQALTEALAQRPSEEGIVKQRQYNKHVRAR